MKQKAVIFDRDGTLAQIDRTFVSHRNDEQRCPMNNITGDGIPWHEYFPSGDIQWRSCKCADWNSFNAAIPFDNPVPAVVAMNQSVRLDWAVIVCSGRNEDFRRPMIDWLSKHSIRADYLLMRGSKDQRADHKVKMDIYRDLIEPRFDVQYVVDDRPSVIEMWESIPLPVVRVSNPENIPVFLGLGVDSVPSVE